MPKELDEFYEAIKFFDVDEAIGDNEKVQSYLDGMKKFGQDALERLKDFYLNIRHKKPPKPGGLVRTISETAFLEPKDGNIPLDEVTKPNLPENSIESNFWRNVSYSVSDFSVVAKIKDEKRKRTIAFTAGDKIGVQYTKYCGSTVYNGEIEHNIFSGRTSAEYSFSTPVSSYCASIYHRDGYLGGTLSYVNNKGFVAAASFDGNNKAISAGYTHKFNDFNLTVRGFLSTFNQRMDDFPNKNNLCTFGITGNITM